MADISMHNSFYFCAAVLCVLAQICLVHGVLFLTPNKEFSVRVGIKNPDYVDCKYEGDLLKAKCSRYDDCYNGCFGKDANKDASPGEECKSFTWDSDEKTCYFCTRDIDDDGVLANETMRWVGHRVRRYIDRCPIDIPVSSPA